MGWIEPAMAAIALVEAFGLLEQVTFDLLQPGFQPALEQVSEIFALVLVIAARILCSCEIWDNWGPAGERGQEHERWQDE